MDQDIERKNLMLSIAAEFFWDWNLKTDLFYLNPIFRELTGYSPEEAVFDSAFLKMIIHPDDHDNFFQAIHNPLHLNNNHSVNEYRIISKDGTVHWMAFTIRNVEKGVDGKALRISGTVTDITLQKQTESELRRLNRAHLAISNCNQALFHSSDEIELLNTICRIIVETGGYKLAWVGYPEQDEAKSIRPIACAGFDEGYLNKLVISWADVAHGHGPAGTAIRTGMPCCSRNILKDPQFEPWRTEAESRGFASIQSFPLKDGEAVFGALTIYSSIPEAFDVEETKLLMSLSENLAYGISMLRTRKAHSLADNELHQSEERYRSLFQNKHNVMLIIDPKGGAIIDANPAAVNYYGWSREELCLMKIGQINLLKDKEIQSEMELARSEKRNYFLFRHLLANGSVRDVEVFSGPITMQGRSLLYSIINDITERKKTEIALKKSEARFRLLFENHSAVMILLDPETGKIIDANRAAVSFYGWTVEKLQQMHILDISNVTPKVLENNMEKARFSTQNQFIFSHRKADGSLCDVEVFSNAIEIEGKNLLYAIIHDVTERIQAENQLKKMSAAVEQSPTVVIITDPSGNIEYVNPTFTKLTGFPAEEVHGKNPRILQSGLMPMTLYENLWRTITSGEIWHGEIQNKKKNGEIYWESAVICAIHNAEGVITNFVSVMEDITDQKLIIDELISAKENAEESDRLKSAFLSNISHEIRTPMNGILGFSQLLKEPHLSGEEQAEYIDLILQSGQRMLNLINDLMDISRIDAKETKLDITETSLNTLLRDIYAFFKDQVNKKGLHFTYTAGLTDVESLIETDADKLNQVLLNLIQNALKFTSKGGINFGYSKKGDFLEFYVIDSGIGIPMEMQHKIFERFRQVNNSLTRAHEGAGLGLSITKAFVELLGGTLSVSSVEGAGSTFTFSLPYHPKQLAIPSLEDQPAASVADLTILIAEDDDVSSMLLKKNLTGDNISLLFAVNGWEAVELVEHHPEINVVLMDIKMPLMNGFEATKLIKKIRPDLPVIAQTAFTSKDDREKALEAGCDSFITKPIKKKELLSLVQELLHH